MADIDFLRDLKALASGELTALGYPPNRTDSLDDILVRYITVSRRIPATIHWKIESSKDLVAKRETLSPSLEAGLSEFVRKATHGEPLRPYLSKTIRDPGYADLMFFDWGVHHFHLGTTVDSHGFINRTNELLFALTDPAVTTMYLIDLYPHQGAFSRQELLRIIEENWPAIADRYSVKGVVALQHNATDDEVKKLRAAGINVLVQTPSGRVMALMGGGLTTAKTSMLSQRDAMAAKKAVKELEKGVLKLQPTLEAYFLKEHGKKWKELQIRLTAFSRTHYKIEELSTGTLIDERIPVP